MPGRIEIKYVVSDEIAAAVLRASRQYLEPDRGLAQPQRVTSLYLDAPDFTFLQWHRQDRHHRFKLRIRGYGDAPGQWLYAEIKQRAGELIRKRRSEFSAALLHSVLSGDMDFPNYDLAEFIQKRKAFRAEPKVLVRCYRQSLRKDGPDGENAVTADYDIVSRPASHWDLYGSSSGWESVQLPGRNDSDSALVELKYSQEPPPWMKSLMDELERYRVGFSKYRAAMQPNYWNCVAYSSE